MLSRANLMEKNHCSSKEPWESQKEFWDEYESVKYNKCVRLLDSGGEGTGTRPDYLVNRVPKKLRGHPGGKNARKSRNSCKVNGRGCGCIGTVDSEPKCAQS